MASNPDDSQGARFELWTAVMRDIRDELKARLGAVMGRYADAMHHFQVENERLIRERRAAVEAFETEKATLDAMIAMEERRLAGDADKATAPMPTSSLRDVIVTTIQTQGPIDKDGVREVVRAAGFAENGRTFNMTFQNVVAGVGIKKLDDGKFADGRSTGGLFGMGHTTGEAPMTAQ